MTIQNESRRRADANVTGVWHHSLVAQDLAKKSPSKPPQPAPLYTGRSSRPKPPRLRARPGSVSELSHFMAHCSLLTSFVTHIFTFSSVNFKVHHIFITREPRKIFPTVGDSCHLINICFCIISSIDHRTRRLLYLQHIIIFIFCIYLKEKSANVIIVLFLQ